MDRQGNRRQYARKVRLNRPLALAGSICWTLAYFATDGPNEDFQANPATSMKERKREAVKEMLRPDADVLWIGNLTFPSGV